MTNVLVSVIIPTYKRPTYLERAIDSVLNQTYKNIEIIVVDDNDPESEGRKLTEKVMSNYLNNNRIIYAKHDHNKNGSAARNTGARIASGDYYAFLDDDDEFCPKKIESQLECITNHDKSFQICYSYYERFDSKKRLIDRCGEHREGSLCLEVLKRNFYAQAGSNLLVSKKAYWSIGGFDESFQRNQDLEFLSRLLQKFNICYCKVKGLNIYVDNNPSMSIDYGELTKQYKKRFNSIIESFSKCEQKEIDFFLWLQVYRSYYLSKQKEKAKLIKEEHELSLFSIYRYFFHLFIRKITKRCCGYMIKTKA